MIPVRRQYQLSPDQPILQRNRRRRRAAVRVRPETDFWKHFDVEKLARDWRLGLGKKSA